MHNLFLLCSLALLSDQRTGEFREFLIWLFCDVVISWVVGRYSFDDVMIS